MSENSAPEVDQSVEKQPSPVEFRQKMGNLISQMSTKGWYYREPTSKSAFIHMGEGDGEIFVTRDPNMSDLGNPDIKLEDKKKRYTVITHDGFRELQIAETSSDAGIPHYPDRDISMYINVDSHFSGFRKVDDGYSTDTGTLRIGEFAFDENGNAFRNGKPIEGSKLATVATMEEQMKLADSIIDKINRPHKWNLKK